jgi:7,8-dihydroneopterin aldolase/epimerase/oxygenase
MPDKVNSIITLADIDVQYRVGVPDSERAHPQRLLITIEMEVDSTQAVRQDDVTLTVDYHQVVQWLVTYGRDRTWKLIETLANDVAAHLIRSYPVLAVTVEIKKFVLPEARFVSVRIRRMAAIDGSSNR